MPPWQYSLLTLAATTLAWVAYKHPNAYVKNIRPKVRIVVWLSFLTGIIFQAGMMAGVDSVKEFVPAEKIPPWWVTWPLIVGFLAIALFIEMLGDLKSLLELNDKNQKD